MSSLSKHLLPWAFCSCRVSVYLARMMQPSLFLEIGHPTAYAFGAVMGSSKNCAGVNKGLASHGLQRTLPLILV